MAIYLKIKVVKQKILAEDYFTQTPAGLTVIVKATPYDDFEEGTFAYPKNIIISDEVLSQLCGPCRASVSLICIYDETATLRITQHGGDEKTVEKICERIAAFFQEPSVLLDYEDNPVIPQPTDTVASDQW